MMATAVALGDSMDRQSSTRLIGSFRYCLVLAGIAVIGVVPGASARVTTLTVNDSQPAFSGATFGSVGTYEVITGTFTDEITQVIRRMPSSSILSTARETPTERSASRQTSKLSDRPTWRIRHTG